MCTAVTPSWVDDVNREATSITGIVTILAPIIQPVRPLQSLHQNRRVVISRVKCGLQPKKDAGWFFQSTKFSWRHFDVNSVPASSLPSPRFGHKSKSERFRCLPIVSTNKRRIRNEFWHKRNFIFWAGTKTISCSLIQKTRTETWEIPKNINKILKLIPPSIFNHGNPDPTKRESGASYWFSDGMPGSSGSNQLWKRLAWSPVFVTRFLSSVACLCEVLFTFLSMRQRVQSLHDLEWASCIRCLCSDFHVCCSLFSDLWLMILIQE